jgi:MFS family permease
VTSARPGAALALLASTQLLLIMDTAIINVALPSVGEDLGSGSAGLSWVANAYLITFGGLLLLGGRTADLLGHRRLYLTGLGLLAAASAAGGLAGTAGTLIAARAAQGVGAALAAAAAFALLLGLFPDGPGRHKALGAFAAMGGLGGVLGTVLGGVLTDLLGWRSTFWLNVLVGLALGLLALRLLDGGTRSAQPGFDLGGALTATGGLGLLPLSLVVVAVAPQTGRLIFRFGLRSTMTLGFALLFAGMVWLALALTADGTFAGTVLAPSLVLGVALPLVMVTTNVAATAEAAPKETGLASGLINTSQQFGSVLGLAVLVAVATASGGSSAAAQASGFRSALLAGAAFAALATLLSVRLRLPVPAMAPRRQDPVGGAVE